jgi:hypothetical protein
VYTSFTTAAGREKLATVERIGNSLTPWWRMQGAVVSIASACHSPGKVHARGLIAAAVAAVLMVGSGTATARGGPEPAHRAAVHGFVASPRPGVRARPGRADWQKIKVAAHLRRTALEPHRSAHFRAFAAFLGLSELVTIHPLRRGHCATAVIYLYDNLLDLQDAYQGENWNPLRRAVAKEPSIRACAPPQPRHIGP